MSKCYRGRLAPSPTGLLHLGHARTFWTAQQRACDAHGVLVLRNEDLDPSRSKTEFARAMLEDLRWFGIHWQEGPDCGGPCGPYAQSERRHLYQAALDQLLAAGFIYPCTCSRQDVLRALQAPHAGEDEPVYPGTCRPKASPKSKVAHRDLNLPAPGGNSLLNRTGPDQIKKSTTCQAGDLHPVNRDPPRINWRFHVPDGETISFTDGRLGLQKFEAGKDFGDFIVWRHDDVPAYQLAVVVDDAAMRITEVVRGEDLLKSAARQLLIYRALGLTVPAFYHCPLVTDESGDRLAKRHDALSLRSLRAAGVSPESLRRGWA